MARRTLLVLAATLLASVLVPGLPASAGGGCHGTAPTTGKGDTVEMKDLCFRPSNLSIEPGDTVTFVNRDAATHNVSAMGWGHFEDMAQGDAFEATFDAEGIYPFACNYHLGMTGAIVVGDGVGTGNGPAVTVRPLGTAAVDEAAEPQVVEEPTPVAATGSGDAATGWVLGGAIGLAIGATGGLVLRRRRAA